MSDFTLLCAGAVLATVGGALSDELRSMRIRSRERKAIKVSIADELGEIENTIGKQHEVWEKSKDRKSVV